MIINSSFPVKSCPQNLSNRIFGNVTILEFSEEAYPWAPLGWLVPSGESGFALIFVAYYAVLDACENSC